MKSTESNNIKKKIVKITASLFWLIILVALAVSLYYNQTLQENIYERDNLIEKLTSRDSILNQIMDFEYDSISGTSTYTYRVRNGHVIKYNTLAKELDESKENFNQVLEKHDKILNENNQNIEDYNSLIESFRQLNKEQNDLIKKHNELIKDFNSNIQEFNRTIHELNQTKDSLSSFESIVNLIQKNYGINYQIIRENDKKIISLKTSKLDSALVLFPYFKNRLTRDTMKNVWIIEIETNKKRK